MEDIDIRRTARLLITQHGDAAGGKATERAIALFAKKDFEGVAVWQRIGRAIEELERRSRAWVRR